MEKLKSLGISQMIWLVVCVSFLVTLVFAASTMKRQIQNFLEMSRMERFVEFSAGVGSLIHELQKERGATAAFLASKGEKFGDVLSKQRENTDRLMTDLKTMQRDIEGIAMTPAQDKAYSEFWDRLTQLAKTRSSVDALEIAQPDAVAWYTSLNATAISTVRVSSKLTSDAEMAVKLSNYVVFLSGKDLAGLERAVGASGFATSSFSPARKAKFSQLITSQSVLLDTFYEQTSPELQRMLDRLNNSDASQSVASMRTVALTGTASDIAQITGADWFATISTKIGDLKAIEAELIVQNLSLAGNKKTAATWMLAINALVLLLTFLGLTLGSRLLVRVFSQEFDQALGLLERLSQGDFEITIPKGAQNEVGRISEAMDRFRTAELERREADQNRQQKELRTMEEEQEALAAVRAEEQLAAKRISDVIETCQAGDFSAQVNLDGLSGVFLELANGLNAVLTSAHDAMIAQAELEQNERTRLEKEREAEKTKAEAEKLAEKETADELAGIIRACAEGDFSNRLDMQGKEGVFAQLGMGVNSICETTQTSLEDIRLSLVALADGDLTQQINTRARGVFGEIARALNETLTSFSDLVSQIDHAADGIHQTSSNLSTATEQLKGRTARQAAVLEATNTALEQLSVTVRSSTDNAEKGRNFIDDLKGLTERGTGIVDTTVEKMLQIDEDSKRVSEISKQIDTISLQTNLLALNAAVEAASAGDSGKGFAVVASEVSTLAMRSAEASQEISDLINSSKANVAEGVRQVNESKTAFSEIVVAVDEINDLISFIANAAHEQEIAIRDVSASVNETDNATRQNKAMVEQNAQLMDVLTSRGLTLKDKIKFFQTADMRMPQSEQQIHRRAS